MAPAHQVEVTAPVLVGLAFSLLTIIIHALFPGMIVRFANRHAMRGRAGIWLWDVTFVIGATMLLLVGHLVEIALWGLPFVCCGEISSFVTALYYSAATYTTLGDDAIVLSARWRLLAPIEAAVGMLMFGLSTAMIFAVIHRFIEAQFEGQGDATLKRRKGLL
jgi:voltage-gated potassium channel Kch